MRFVVGLLPSSKFITNLSELSEKSVAGAHQMRSDVCLSEPTCHPTSHSHGYPPDRRPYVHLRGWKTNTRKVQGSEPQRPDIPRDTRALEGIVLPTRHSSQTRRRSGKFNALLALGSCA